MSQPDKKLEKFNSAVLRDAEEQRAKILAEIDEYRASEMEKAEEDILHEAYIMIQNEIAVIKNRQSRQVSLAELESRRKLLKLREELTVKVFEEAAAKVLEYTKTPAYQDSVCKAVKKSCSEMPEGEIIVEVKNDDLSLRSMLVAASGRSKIEIKASDNIELGGVIVSCPEKGLVTDETLDQKLVAQRDWFASNSGLTLGL